MGPVETNGEGRAIEFQLQIDIYFSLPAGHKSCSVLWFQDLTMSISAQIFHAWRKPSSMGIVQGIGEDHLNLVADFIED